MGQTPFIKWEGLKTYCTAVHYSYNVEKSVSPFRLKYKVEFNDVDIYTGIKMLLCCSYACVTG